MQHLWALFPLLFPIGTPTLLTRRPLATYAIILVNLAVHIVTWIGGDQVFHALALGANPEIYQHITYGFVQPATLPGLLQLAVRMWFVFVFGPPLEDKVGVLRTVAFYLAGVVGGGMAHTMFHPSLNDALAGASPGVYGLIGAYLIIHPFTEIRCFFALFILVIPIKMTVTELYGFFFLLVYWLMDFVSHWVALSFGFELPYAIVLTSQLGGLGAGVGLAAALYGFYAFTMQAEEDRQAEIRLQRKLAGSFADGQTGLPARPTGSGLMVHRKVDPDDPRLMPLHRAVISNQQDEILSIYRGLVADRIDFCLQPGPQMDLVRALIRHDAQEEAIHALEALLKAYGREPIADMARYELARLLQQTGRDAARAMQLLHEFLASGPAMDLETDARALLAAAQAQAQPPPRGTVMPPIPENPQLPLSLTPAPMIKSAGALFLSEGTDPPGHGAGLGTTAMFEQLALDGLPEPELVPTGNTDQLFAQADALFGNLDDTNLNRPAARGATPAPAWQAPPRDPSATDSDFVVNIAESKITMRKAGGKDAGPIVGLNADNPVLRDEPGFVPQYKQMFHSGGDPGIEHRQSRPPVPPPVQIMSPHAPFDSISPPSSEPDVPLNPDPSAPTRLVPTIELSLGPPARARRPRATPEARPPEPGPKRKAPGTAPRSEADGPSLEALEFGASTVWGEREQPLAPSPAEHATPKFDYRPTGRYSVLLSPGKPIDMSVITAVLAPALNMPVEATHHALLRRRGMLAEGLGAGPARLLAEQLARNGQAVLVADEQALPEFPPAEDLFEIGFEGDTARTMTSEGAHVIRWSEVWMISAGQVVLKPGAPARNVVDLLVGRPALELRMWENLFRFPSQVEQTIARQFLAKVSQVLQVAPQALRTRTLTHWLESNGMRPPHRFNSLIEYDNFVRWHLLAFFAPKKEYRVKE